MSGAVNIIVSFIWAIIGLVMSFIAYIDALLAGMMTSIGIPANVQTILLIVVAISLIVLAVRLFSRLIAALIVVLLVLLLINKIDPNLVASHGHQPVAHLNQGTRASTQ
ncbi:MAG TPA: hypothetical protein PK677_14200 [Acidiphilium sp.]|nr:MAG: hypothetical protein B7Z57_13120 [Acidiphilium sp. 37-60-79]OZB38131.1 MAG: hypothetical protein B7X48_14355 [Acidiphilium sp. 34-60-192]HQT89676.1 hypothetical protein [Acidiphilium sp.]